MRVLLINPPRFRGIPVIREERCEVTERYSVLPPYSLMQIASILRSKGHHVQLIDANGEDLDWKRLEEQIRNAAYEVLVFRFAPTTFEWDNRTASISKKHHPQAIAAGICWTLQSVPLEVLQGSLDLDVYIRHEYEVVTPTLVSAVSEGRSLAEVPGIAYRTGEGVKTSQPSRPIFTWDSMPMPAYDLLPSLNKYYINTPHGSPFTIIYASKGCPYSCVFCTERNTRLKNRAVESILNELRYLKEEFGVRTVSFFDEAFTIDKKRVVALAKALKHEGLGITWYCNTRVDLVDRNLLETMREGGCGGISFGVESGSQEILDNVVKGTTVEQAENAVKWAREAGIKTYCSFIFGLPGENWRTVGKTIEFVKRVLPTGAQFNVAVPYPGTELHRIAVERGWIKKGATWRKMFQHEAIMRTDELSPEDLNEARRKAYQALYLNPEWWLNNVWYTLKHPDDVALAVRYVSKIMDNYLLRGMRHAH